MTTIGDLLYSATMKLYELESKYIVNRVSFISTLSEIYRSNSLKRKGMVLLFIFFTLFRLINNYLGLILDYSKYSWSYNAILIIFSVVFTSYLLQTAMDLNSRVFCKERFNRSIILLIYIVKTLLLLIVYILPVIFMAAIAFVILYLGASALFEFSNPDSVSIIFSTITAVVTSCLILQYCYGTYLVVTHHENGFSAIRLSRMIFRGNLKSSIALFSTIMILPAAIILSVDYFVDNSYINILVDIVTSGIVFIGHFIIAAFLTKGAIRREETSIDG